MVLPWLLLACTLPGTSTPASESPAAQAATEIASVAKAAEELAAEAEQIALLTESLLQGVRSPESARQELSERVASARAKGQDARSALERATIILAGSPKSD